uniref:Uncharacterized protein n=1 Tax=viral metagenome TaxID=1070528 RepID=A0A6M3MJG2_9ZZZZ
MLKIDGSTEKHWVIGHPAMALTGRAFHDELHAFAKGARHQIDGLLEIDPNIDRLELRPVLVEVTVRLCSEEETKAHQAYQEQWLADRRQPTTAA